MNLDTKRCSGCLHDLDARAARCEHCGQRQTDVGLYRDVPGRALGGVCASLAQHFNWDVTLMRIAFVASLAFTGGLVFWVYGAAWLMTPYERGGRAPLVRFVDAVARVFSPPRGQPSPLARDEQRVSVE